MGDGQKRFLGIGNNRYRNHAELSGAAGDTPVADAGLGGHSPFAYHLLDALEHNPWDWIDPMGLYEYVKRGVEGQAPQYGVLPFAGHQNGGSCILRLMPEQGKQNPVKTKVVEGMQKNTIKAQEPEVWKKPNSAFSIPMTYVQGGTFRMGSKEYGDEEPVHSVTVDSFYMGTYQVTQDIYEEVMGDNPSNWKGSRLPVEEVSWDDAVAFCNVLSRRDGLEEVYTIKDETVMCDWSKKGYQLPTEAEWEYAARGGKLSKGFTYAGSNTAGDVSWYGDNSGSNTHEVGTKKANELGLYDMSGNVYEWVWDRYEFSYYDISPATNPHGPASGFYQVIRGGSWYDNAIYVRTAYRNRDNPWYRSDDIGFRLLVPLVKELKAAEGEMEPDK